MFICQICLRGLSAQLDLLYAPLLPFPSPSASVLYSSPKIFLLLNLYIFLLTVTPSLLLLLLQKSRHLQFMFSLAGAQLGSQHSLWALNRLCCYNITPLLLCVQMVHWPLVTSVCTKLESAETAQIRKEQSGLVMWGDVQYFVCLSFCEAAKSLMSQSVEGALL